MLSGAALVAWRLLLGAMLNIAVKLATEKMAEKMMSHLVMFALRKLEAMDISPVVKEIVDDVQDAIEAPKEA